jgi:transcriptional regulator with XRE-family HTH domain
MVKMANSKVKDGMYHYTECGLDYVFLSNGWERVQTDYGDGTRIEDVDGLHLCIARHIVERPGAIMSGREFRFLRVFLDLSQKSFGSMMGISDQAVAKWEKRSADVPKWANNFMRALFREIIDGNADLASALEQISEAERKIDGLERQLSELHLRLAKHNESEEWVEEPAKAA